MPPRKKKFGRNDQWDHDEIITIRGLVTPVDWDENGNVTAAAVSTFDENEYLIDKGAKGDQMLSLLRREVEIRGELREANGKKIIKVNEYDMNPNLRSKDKKL